MEIVNQKREMDMYVNHINRIKSMTAFIDTSTPSSLGLKHLAARPKKQQLIDDRRQEIAKENKKLMENMAKILSENKMNSKLNSSSNLRHTINETQRKNAVEKLNFENRLLYSRFVYAKYLIQFYFSFIIGHPLSSTHTFSTAVTM